MPTLTERLAAEKHQGSRTSGPGVLARFLAPILPSETLSDYWEGPKYALTHPGDAASLVWDAIKKDPIGAVPVVGNAKRGFADVKEGNLAGAAGEGVSALLALLGARKGAPELSASLEEGMGNAARSAAARAAGPLDTMGRGLEATGTKSKPLAVPAAVGTFAAGHPLAAVGELAMPFAAEAGGRGMQKLASALKGFDAQPEMGAYVPNRSSYGSGVSSEIPYRYEGPAAQVPEADPLPQSSLLTGADQYEHGGPGLDVDRPGRSSYVSQDPRAPLPDARPGGHAPDLHGTLDDILKSLSGDAGTVPTGDTPSVRSAERGNMPGPSTDLWSAATARQAPRGFDWLEAGGRFEPNDIGSHVLVDPTPTAVTPAAASTGGPSYADWASDIDQIVNEAAADGSADKEFAQPSRRWTKADYRRMGYTSTPQFPELSR